MATILFEQPGHRCIAFSDLVRGDDGVQANQFLIQHGDASALLDPGGALLYNPLILALSNPIPEIMPELAKQTRPDALVCTGRSDYPNQVNNVLCFPTSSAARSIAAQPPSTRK